MLSQFDSNILQLPTLPGRILVRQVTQLFMSNDFFFLAVYHSLQTTILNWTTQRLNLINQLRFRL